jgi:gliding motility-associated-like protein
MRKLYLPFQSNDSQQTNLQNAINKNDIKVLFLFLLFISNLGFGQLALQNFDNGIPLNWVVQSNISVANNWQATATGGYLATGGATVNPALNNTVGTTAEYFLISEQFITPSNGEIKFFTKQGSFTNRGTIYQLRISTSSQPDISGFNVVLQSWTEAQLNVSATTYEEKTVSIGSIQGGIPVYIAFVAITNQTGTSATIGDSWFVDNVRAISACGPVSNVTTITGSSSASINWSHPTATDFEIQVVTSGTGIGATGTPVTGLTYTANGLSNNTTYDVYIKANCNSSSSTWQGPTTFTTSILGLACNSPIIIPPDVSTTPYVLSSNLNVFNNNDTYIPLNSQGLSCAPPNTPSTWNWFNNQHIFLSYTPSTSGLVNFSQQIQTSGSGCFANTISSVFIFDSCAGVATDASCLGAFTTGNPSSVTYNELTNFYVQAGQTYIILISSAYGSPQPGVCFTFTLSAPTCPTVFGLSFQNLTQTSANFSWANPQNLVSAWEYIVKPASQGAPNSSDLFTSTTTNLNNLVSELIPGENYNFYVRSVCNGTPGAWSNPYSFTTLCTPFSTPYYSGFNNEIEIACWNQLNLNNDAHFFNFGNDANGQPVAKLRTSGLSLLTDDMLISPQVILDGVTQKQLRFKYNIYGNWGPAVNPTPGPGNFEIKLSTTGIGSSNFTTTLVPLTSYITGYNYIEMIVPIPLDIVGNVNIAWILPLGSIQTGIQFYVDDVYIENLPPCSPPSYPLVTPGSITETSATFSWTNGYNNSQWEVIAVPFGNGVPTINGILVTTNPYTLEGLTHSTKYEFYIRTICDETLQSDWIGPVVFNTLCGAQELPYLETFNDTDLTSKKFCWSDNNVSNDLTKWRIEATEASIRVVSTMNQPFVSFNDWLISAPINVVGQKVLKYKYRAATSIFYPTARGNFEVLVSSSPDFATYTVLKPSEDFFNSDYQTEEIIFTGTGVSYFAFRVPPTMTNPGNSGIIMIDDVSIENIDLCPNPSNLSVTNITTTSAVLNWTIGYVETQWEVVIQAPYSGVPTVNGITVNTNPTYTANGLTTDTNYEYYVRAICQSPDVSTWIGPFRFKTKCNVLPTPFHETFDANSTTESCWEVVNNNGDAHFWNLDQPVNPIAGDQMASIFSGSNGNNDDWLITPTLNIQPNQRLRYKYRVYNSFFTEDYKIKLSTNGTALSSFSNIIYENSFSTTTDASGTIEGTNTLTVASASGIQVGDTFYIPNWPFPYGTAVTAISGNVLTMSNNATLTQTGVYPVTFTHEVINNTVTKEKVINLTDITEPTNTNIAFHIPFFPPNPWSYRGQYLFIDNVIVEDIPACPSVINITQTNIIDTSVTLNWETVGTETSWEISMQPFGTPAPVGATLPAYLHTTTTRPYTVTELTPATMYQYYIRAICSSSEQSEWVGPFTVTTKCDFSDLCEYTITVNNGTTGRVTRHLNLMQNGEIVQEINFPVIAPNLPTTLDYIVYLCNGVEYSLYWEGSGSGLQYSQAQATIKDQNNNVIWTSPLGLGTINTNIFTGIASCGTITCPQPTNLSVNNQGTLSWTAGGSESQWEVFIQPLANGTLPQSGTIVNTTNYTPVAADFVDPHASTYEYFVRAICSETNKSFWSGPKIFIRNDEAINSVTLPINTTNDCVHKGENVSFIGATASANETACQGGNNGDVWFDFVATSKVHNIELSDFAPGSYYTSAFVGEWPRIVMSLYEVQSDGSLIEKSCSENNSMTTVYSSELVVGTTYKVRLKLISTANNDKKLKICISTPTDICNLNAFNHSFEKLPMQSVTGVPTIINAIVVPGWRVNTNVGQIYFQEGSNSPGVIPIDGAQAVQLVHDNASTWDPSSLNLKGLYKDFDTSEAIQVDYSFLSAARSSSTLELWAGPPAGPFTLVTEHFSNTLVWALINGTYIVPAGQNTTRFLFRVKNYAFGHLLDTANFKVNTDILTDDTSLSCEQTSINVEAIGVGEWIADENNPNFTTIANPNEMSTVISGFNVSGSFNYYWKTRYCERILTIDYQGITETPTVANITLCKNEIATALTATVPAGNTLLWFTSLTEVIGSSTAPVPNTTNVGLTTYYVSLVNSNGCIGPRIPLTVNIIELPTATITGNATICSGNMATITFNGTPEATVSFSINSQPSQTVSLNASGTATYTTEVLTSNTTIELINVVSSGTPSCTAILTGNVIITVTPLNLQNLVFTYADSCINATINPVPTPTTGFATGGSYSSSTLTVDETTGTINLATATVGTHEITYTLAANTTNCTAGGSHTATIEILPEVVPIITFNYDSVYCTSNANVLPVLSTGFQTGGVFSSTAGLVINSATGEINIANSDIGIYTITYTLAANPLDCMVEGTHTTSIQILPEVVPITTFSFNSEYCKTVTTVLPVLATGFQPGGVFSSTTGLVIDSSTGEINIANSDIGTYVVTYSIAANQTACLASGSHNVSIQILDETLPVTTFSFNPIYCTNSSNALPTLTTGFQTGGVFSSSPGLEINANTGEINFINSLIGNYTITYSVGSNTASCTSAGTHSVNIEILQTVTPITSFSYDTQYCASSSNVIPVLATGFQTGGVFSSTAGLVINSTTGEINITNSLSGNYVITYSLPANPSICINASVSMFTISILNTIETEIVSECESNSLLLVAQAKNNSYNPSEANYLWTFNNSTIGNAATFDVGLYLRQNSSLSLPITINLTVTYNGCAQTFNYVVSSNPCGDIPRGFSPNGDGVNDTFDLTGFDVTEIYIYNRYGTNVYTFNGNYTNQWNGEYNGETLPSGAYFYNIVKSNGSKLAGWVYINK